MIKGNVTIYDTDSKCFYRSGDGVERYNYNDANTDDETIINMNILTVTPLKDGIYLETKKAK